MSNKIKTYAPEIILLGAVFFLQFFRLGIGEIQQWDESLYLVRVEAIEKFGCWLDQTRYAVGGLYSSSHPPLIVWMMTIGRMIFGHGVFTSRLIPAVSAVIAIIFFYKLCRIFFSRESSLFAALSLGTAQHFLWYSHHAQLDIPMFACIVVAAYYAVRTFQESRIRFAILSGLFYGCAFLSKAVWGLYLIPFLFSLPYIFQSTKRYRNLAIIIVTSIIVALPWYMFMGLRYPLFSANLLELIGSFKTGTYANRITTSWWYYINQSFVNFPLLILGVSSLSSLMKQWRMRDTIYRRLSLVSAVWFLLLIIVLSSFNTRMLHFSLALLLPISLNIAFFIEEFLRFSEAKIKISITAILILCAVAWSGSEVFRIIIKEHRQMSIEFMPIVFIVLSSFALAFLFYKNRYFSMKATIILFSSSLMLIGDFYRWGSRKDEVYIDGARQTAEIILQDTNIHSVNVFHADFAHESLMPQFNYYTYGVLLGWDTTKRGSATTWNTIDSLMKIGNIPRSDAAVVYDSRDTFFYKQPEDEKELLARINNGFTNLYSRSQHTKKYQLYWDRK